eukprot:GEMP01007885.1.p1 GENE.GEMP01007885.1~~GEMP01007885.1.p1  ORF type:complete len:879 (+),score=208.91 GEMP01007885.1:194-2830(+)
MTEVPICEHTRGASPASAMPLIAETTASPQPGDLSVGQRKAPRVLKRPYTSPTTRSELAISSFPQREKELIEVRARLANMVRCVSADMSGHAAFLEAQELLRLDSDADGGDADVGIYEELLDAQMRKCDPQLEIIESRMEKYFAACLTANEQQDWKLAFSNPMTKEQKAGEFATIKNIAGIDRLIARRRIQISKRVTINKALEDNCEMLFRSTQSLERELAVRKSQSQDFKLSAEYMQGQVHFVHDAVKLLPVTEQANKSPGIVHGGNRVTSSPNTPATPAVEDATKSKSKDDTSVRLSAILHKLILDNDRLHREYDLAQADTLLYHIKLKAMRKELKENWGTGKCGVPMPHTGYFDQLHRNLEAAPQQLEFKPTAEIHCPSTSAYEPLGTYSPEVVQELQMAFEGILGEGPRSPFFVTALALEFGKHCARAELMTSLIHDLESLNRSPNEDEAFQALILIIEKTLVCHIARLWQPMKHGGGYWTRIYGTRNVAMIAPGEKHIVRETFESAQIRNACDVYTEEGYDKSEDQKTGYRTKAMICVPIGTQPGSPAAAVMQAINKITPSASAFDDFDGFLLHVIGSAYMQVIQELHGRTSMKYLAKRKDVLIAVAEELFQKKDLSQKDLFVCMQERLVQLFNITDCCLTLCGDLEVARMQLGATVAEVVATEPPDKGLVGICIKKKVVCHYENRKAQKQALSEHYNTSRQVRIDLATEGRLTLWPILDGNRVVSIIQFSQPVEDFCVTADARAFDPSDAEHAVILKKFFAMLQYFVEKWWPQVTRFAKAAPRGGPEANLSVERKSMISNLFTSAFSSVSTTRGTDLDFGAFSVFRRLIGPEEEWADGILGLAASKIQQTYRERVRRRKERLAWRMRSSGST